MAIAADVARCAKLLADGGVAAIPTDTLYGLAASIRAPEAVGRVLAIKTRSPGGGVPVLVASAAQAAHFAEMSPEARRLAQAFWPGAVTLVLPARPGLTAGCSVPTEPLAFGFLPPMLCGIWCGWWARR